MNTASPSIVSSRNKLIWLLLAVLGTTTYLAGYIFPPALKTQNHFVKDCPQQIYNTLGYSCEGFNSNSGSIFALEITDVKPKNQFVSLEALPVLSDKAKSNQLELDVEVTSYAVLDDYQIQKVYENKAQKKVVFDCGITTPQGSVCIPRSFGDIVQVDHDHYMFIVKFLNTDEATTSQIQEFRLVFATEDSTFADYLMYFKVIMFVLSIIGLVIYRLYLGKISTDLSSSEQRYIGYLSVVLVFLNQPFLQYSPSEPSFYLSLFGVITISLQSALLILFWFVVVERLASADAVLSSGGKTLIRTVALIHFTASVIGYTLIAQDQQNNPQADIRTSQNPLVAFYRLYVFSFSAVTTLWTVIRLFRIVRKYKDLDWRDSTSFTFSFCYVLCHLFFIATGSLQVVSYKGPRVVLLFGISTLYTLLLQVIYAPFEHEVEESEKRRNYETPETHQGQFGELDMSDASSPNLKNDNVQLRNADANQKNRSDYEA